MVDWDWLRGLGTPQARVAALNRLADESSPLVEEPDGWYSDSARQHFEAGEGLETAAQMADAPTTERIRTAFPLVYHYRLDGPDELGLRSVPESYYIGSLSAEAVAAAVEATRQLDLPALGAAAMPEDPAEGERYLRQWAAAFAQAAARGRGIVAHCS